MCREKINLILMNGTAYVWTPEDWWKIRNLRILGNFVGTLAKLPRQNQMTGLPLALLDAETTLMIEKGYATLSSVPNISNPPSCSTLKSCETYRQKLFNEQVEILTNKRKREIESKIDIILEGKKAKLKQLNLEEDLKKVKKESVLQQELKKIQPPKKSNLVTQIFIDDPWLKAKDFETSKWEFPKNQKEKLHYLVYKDLWEKKYYITPGGKFGGDFLVYPGDPVKFHAFFIILCIQKDKQLKMNEIITYGRLGQSVRKTTVLAYLSNDCKVTYQSLQWAGF